MMHKLRGSPKIIVYLFYFLCLWCHSQGYCLLGCTCNDDILRVVCDSTNLDVVPNFLNPELKELILSNNRISSIRDNFIVYRNLEYLDISSNILVNLGEGNFASLQHLNILLISHNKINLLTKKTFVGLNSLKFLHLKENFLENLPDEIFNHLKILVYLDLSKNKIMYISNNTFAGLNNLETLLLHNNKLSTIPSESFLHIPKLLKLNLSYNYFENIPENSFALNKLKELSLDSCGIKTITLGAFKWLSSLVSLHIQNNELTEIPTKALFDVIHLEELHIGQNKLIDIKTKSFQRLSSLHTVNISGCPILEIIKEYAFADNANLKTVIISNNKVLKHVELGAFDSLPNVKHVSLRANAFETFHEDLLPWGKLYSLDLSDNPLVCNCTISWLWNLLLTKNFTSIESLSDTNQIICANPPNLRNNILLNLKEIDLDCHTVDAKRQVIIGIVLAGAVASAAIIMIGFRYRDKVADVLKTKWEHGRKEHQYQKTYAEEENTILQAAQQSLKLTPVTEL